mgnify:FL=1
MYAVPTRNTTRGIASHAVLQAEVDERRERKLRSENQKRKWLEAIRLDKEEKRKQTELLRRDGSAKIARERLWRLPELMREVVLTTASKHCVDPLLIMVDCRKHAIVKARNEALYRIKQKGGDEMSHAYIARRFCRDHTVVLHSCASHSALTGEPPLSSYDVIAQRVKKAERARTRYLWKDAA